MSGPALHCLLALLLSLLSRVQGDSSLNSRRFNALKFGNTKYDYVMYKPDMTPLESAFTVCTWVRKLRSSQYGPTWFSYGVNSNPYVYEIQMTDMGYRMRLFGSGTDLRRVYTSVSGSTWFHNCMSWSAASQTRNVYINGELVGASGTPAGRKLQMDGYLLIGNELTGYGTGMDDVGMFAGELYKLNVFSRMLSNSEIKQMSRDRCSTVEESYGAARHIRWEDLLQVSRTGNVSEIACGCVAPMEIQMMVKLEQIEDKLNKTLAEPQGDSTLNNRRFNALKFGDSVGDYVMYKPDMTPLESAFTVCAWVRKLRSEYWYYPTWFSYGVDSDPYVYEIQITDMGHRTRLFGDSTYLRSVYIVSEGTWFHNCMSWSAASQSRNVYINGELVDARGTPAGRKLQMDGYLLIGNELDRYGGRMDRANTFAGELYKLNVFSRMLTTSEIKEMSKDRCSTVEESYGAERHIRWEDLLQVSRTGNVSEIASGCTTVEIKMMVKLEHIEDKLNKTLAKLATAAVAQEKLEWTEGKLRAAKRRIVKLEKTQEKTEEQLNDTRTALTNTAWILSETATQQYDTLMKVDELMDEVLSVSEKAEELEEEMDSCHERVDKLEEEMTSCYEEVDVAKSGCHGSASNSNITRNLDN